MKTVLVLLLLSLVGCQSLPSMQYCDSVQYTRKGNAIVVHAECHAPMGDIVSIPGVSK